LDRVQAVPHRNALSSSKTSGGQSSNKAGRATLDTTADRPVNKTDIQDERRSVVTHRAPPWEIDDQEVIFKDLAYGAGINKFGHRMIRFCGEQAQKDGLKYFWADSCCT
jgi:hypothetical protein